MSVAELLELARGAFSRAHLDELQRGVRGLGRGDAARVMAACRVSDLGLARDSLRYAVGDLLAFHPSAGKDPGVWRVVAVGGAGTLVDAVNVATGAAFHGSSGQYQLGRAPADLVDAHARAAAAVACCVSCRRQLRAFTCWPCSRSRFWSAERGPRPVQLALGLEL